MHLLETYLTKLKPRENHSYGKKKLREGANFILTQSLA